MYRWSFLAPALSVVPLDRSSQRPSVGTGARASQRSRPGDPGSGRAAFGESRRARAEPRRRLPLTSRRPRRQQPAVPAPQAAPRSPAAATAGTLPPAARRPLVRFIELTFPTQGDQSVIDPQTYVYYIQTQVSRPSAGVWVPYNEKTEQSLLEDFKRLWGTNFLDNLSIDVVDDTYANGVVGKRIIFKMEERQRVKIVDYLGTKKIEQSKIDEKLKEEGVTHPPRLVRRPGH